MTKRRRLRKPPTVAAAALRELQEMGERNKAAFLAPRCRADVLVNKLGVPRSSLDKWLANGEFVLDADKDRAAGGWRLFSTRDAMLIAATAQFSAIGVPLDFAKATAGRICDHVLLLMRAPQAASLVVSKIAIFRRDNQWHVVSEEEVPDDVPPLILKFDIIAFASRVSSELGGGTMYYGTAADIQRALDEEKARG